MSKCTVAVVGYYGHSNFGDDLFQDAAERNGQRLWPGCRVLPVSPRSDRRGTPPSADTFLRSKFVDLYARPDKGGAALRTAALLPRIALSDRVSLFGGSVLTGLSGIQRLQSSISARTSKRFEGLGVSVGPFSSSDAEKRTQDFVSRFDRLVVRDRASLDQVHAWRDAPAAVLGGDIAAIHPLINEPTELRNDRRDPEVISLCIIPCKRPGPESVPYVKGLVRMLLNLRRAGRRLDLSILTLNNHPQHGDDDLARRIVERLREQGFDACHERYADLGLRQTVAHIRSRDFTISTRLHGAIIAYLTGASFAIQNYHSKGADFAAEIGLPADYQLSAYADLDEWDRLCSTVLVSIDRPQVAAMPAALYVQRAAESYGLAR